MSGSHEDAARAAGLTVRNTFAAVSHGTALSDLNAAFVATPSFLRHPYVLAFSVTMIGLMMVKLHGGDRWPLGEQGNFIDTAVRVFHGDEHLFTKADWVAAVGAARGSDDYALGRSHAEVLFAATHGQIEAYNAAPLVAMARKAAAEMPPPATLAAGMLRVTVGAFLQAEFGGTGA